MSGALLRTLFLKSSIVRFRYSGCCPARRGTALLPRRSPRRHAMHSPESSARRAISTLALSDAGAGAPLAGIPGARRDLYIGVLGRVADRRPLLLREELGEQLHLLGLQRLDERAHDLARSRAGPGSLRA